MKDKSETVILVDMDDVMVDLVGHWVDYLNEKYNTNVKFEDITDWNFSMFFPSVPVEEVYKPLEKKNFWKNIKPIEDSIKYLKLLYEEGYQIYICTSTHWKNVKYKYKYVLSKYFDFIPWKNVIIAADKSMVKADYLIDDGIHNLKSGVFKKILFTKPHNMKYDTSDTDIVRVNNWSEIYNYISLSSE